MLIEIYVQDRVGPTDKKVCALRYVDMKLWDQTRFKADILVDEIERARRAVDAAIRESLRAEKAEGRDGA